ncbi:MAG: rRNA maturation RNase YbeY [Pirellulales bacterium]
MLHIAITNQQTQAVDEDRLRRAVRAILEEEGLRSATVSVAIVDDATIHRLNRVYLQHDIPTDVLSFVLDRTETSLDGEVIVSADTAAAKAARFGWTMADELLLYVIHGTLHLADYDDQEPQALAEMRARERHYLASFGLNPRYDDVVSAKPDALPVAK